MSKLKQLAGETVLYGLGSMVPRLLNFLLLPIHTKFNSVLTTEDYGVMTMLMSVVAFVNVVYMFGMETTYFRFASKPGSDPRRVYNLTLTVVLITSLFLSVIFISFSSPIATALEIGNHPEFITWLTLTMLLDAIVAIPFARLRLERKPLLFSFLKIANVIIVLCLNVYFLIFNKNYDPSIGVGYVFLATLIANAFYLLFLFPYLLQWRPAIDKEITPTMFRYAYPIMLTGVAGMTNEMFSRFTLEWWLPENFYPGKSERHALGVFGACYRFAMLMNLAVQAFRFAAEPFFFSNASDKNSPSLFAQINHYFIIVCCILLLGVGINLDILKNLMGEEFWEGMNIVPILLLSYLFLGVYYNLTVWFKLTDKTYYGTIIAGIGAIITIVLNYILIPVAGYVGSSLAALACYVSMTVLCYAIGQKYYPIPYKVGKGLSYIIITMALVYVINGITFSTQFMATAFHSLVLILYCLAVLWIERKELLRALA